MPYQNFLRNFIVLASNSKFLGRCLDLAGFPGELRNPRKSVVNSATLMAGFVRIPRTGGA